MVFKRTHTCGEIRNNDVGKQVVLNGWIDVRRDLGGLIFVDIRDRYGITQIIFDENNKSLHQKAEQLRPEFVIGVKGNVRKRGTQNINEEMPTGTVEVIADELTIYSKAATPPFEIKDDITTNEELRLKYRYLDLRRIQMQQKMMMRSSFIRSVRNYFYSRDFMEVETPYLMKSTPEGARDYLVPSRVNAGKFFALPQSPQTYKQLLMVSGFDRYFQIVKCFRDEDLRADRQPEFTQIDMEMSFVDEEDVMRITEGLMKQVFKDVKDIDLKTPLLKMTYDEAMQSYGTDKPDTRFGLPIVNLSKIVEESDFRIFSKTVQDGGAVLAINIPGQGNTGRGAIDRLTERVQQETGAAGLIYIKQNEKEGIKCSVGKFLKEETINAMIEKADAGQEDLTLILAGSSPEVYKQMGSLRLMMGEEYGLIDYTKYNFCWVVDFPLLKWNAEEQRYQSLHHPFTAPQPDELDKLNTEPEGVKSRGYDLVLNGYEIGGGSIRIHQPELQGKIFGLLGINEKEAKERFGFLLEAFKYGAPPHGGIALGVDRTAMILAGSSSLRDVIAFPKNQNAQNLMDGSPSVVDEEQLDALNIELRKTSIH